MTHIDIQQARDRLPELIDLAVSGEEVIISRDQVPLVKLAPIFAGKTRRKFGSAKGLIRLRDDFDQPLEDLRDYV